MLWVFVDGDVDVDVGMDLGEGENATEDARTDV